MVYVYGIFGRDLERLLGLPTQEIQATHFFPHVVCIAYSFRGSNEQRPKSKRRQVSNAVLNQEEDARKCRVQARGLAADHPKGKIYPGMGSVLKGNPRELTPFVGWLIWRLHTSRVLRSCLSRAGFISFFRWLVCFRLQKPSQKGGGFTYFEADPMFQDPGISNPHVSSLGLYRQEGGPTAMEIG